MTLAAILVAQPAPIRVTATGVVPVKVTLTQPLDRIVVAPVGVPGPAGPHGAIGPSGAAAQAFDHVQITPATDWLVNHNLGFRPSVSVFDSGGQIVIADIVHTSNNQFHVYFLSPTVGTAHAI